MATTPCANPPENYPHYDKDKPFKAIIAIDFGTHGCGAFIFSLAPRSANCRSRKHMYPMATFFRTQGSLPTSWKSFLFGHVFRLSNTTSQWNTTVPPKTIYAKKFNQKTKIGVAFSPVGSDEIFIEQEMWSSQGNSSRPVKDQIKIKTKTAILLNPQNKIVEFGDVACRT